MNQTKRMIPILAVDTLAPRRGTPGDVSWWEEETSDSWKRIEEQIQRGWIFCVFLLSLHTFPGITRHPRYSPNVPWGRSHRHQQNVLAKVRFHLLFNCSNNCDHNVPAEFHKSYQIWIWSYAVNVGACRPWILWEDGRRWWHSCCGVWGQVQCSSYNLMCKVAACMCNHWFQPGGWNCIWLICIPRSTIWWKIKLLLW